jgi:hypothetical protein
VNILVLHWTGMSQRSILFTKFSEHPQTTDTLTVVSGKIYGHAGIKSTLYTMCIVCTAYSECIQMYKKVINGYTGLAERRHISYFKLQIFS